MLKCSHIYNDCSPTTKQCNFVLVLLPSHFRPRRSRSAAAIVIKLSRGRSVGQCVGASVGLSVCIVEKGGSDPDAVWHHKSGVSRMRQVVGFGDRSTERGTFGGEFGARHRNQWELYGVCVRQCRDAAFFPNYFGQTCLFWLYYKVAFCQR